MLFGQRRGAGTAPVLYFRVELSGRLPTLHVERSTVVAIGRNSVHSLAASTESMRTGSSPWRFRKEEVATTASVKTPPSDRIARRSYGDVEDGLMIRRTGVPFGPAINGKYTR